MFSIIITNTGFLSKTRRQSLKIVVVLIVTRVSPIGIFRQI